MGTDMLLTKPYLGYLGPYWKKSIWARSFLSCMDLSEVVYIIRTLKPVNDLKTANQMIFLMLAAGFIFADHLSYWTIYDLKEQF